MYTIRKVIFLMLVALLFFHFSIGSNVLMLALFFVISMIGFLSVTKKNIYFSDVFLFLFGLYSGFCPLLIKGVLMQPVQSNLQYPLTSCFYVFIGYLMVVVCAKLSVPDKKSAFQNVISKYLYDDSILIKACPYITIIGMVFYILHVIYRPVMADSSFVQTEGFGGFGMLYFLIVMGVCIQFHLYSVSKNKKYLLWLAVTAVCIVGLSVVGNVKKNIYDFILICILAIYAFNIRLNIKFLLSSLMLVMVVMLYVSPVIHLMRNDFTEYTVLERGSQFFRILDDYSYSPKLLAEAEGDFFEGIRLSYSPEGSYVFPNTANVDRFLLILPVDQVVRGVSVVDPAGFFSYLSMGLKQAIPSVLIQKDKFIAADVIAWEYGIRDINSIGRPVIGLVASSIAACGVLGVVLYPLVLVLPIFFLINKIAGPLKKNWFCLMVIGSSTILVEYTIDALVTYILREGPTIVLGSICVLIVSKFVWGRQFKTIKQNVC